MQDVAGTFVGNGSGFLGIVFVRALSVLHILKVPNSSRI